MTRRAVSIVGEQGVLRTTSCNHCKSVSSTSVAQRLWAQTLTVDDYQELLNKGWRRSGMVLYKNNMRQSCCPPLSIRLDVTAFRISKDQARVMRCMQRQESHALLFLFQWMLFLNMVASVSRYLEGACNGPRLSDGEVVTRTGKKGMAHDAPEFDSPSTSKKKKTEGGAAVDLAEAIKGAVIRCVDAGALPLGFGLPQIKVAKVSEKIRQKLKAIEGQLEYTCSVAFAIAAAIKRQPRTEVEEEVNSEQEFSPKQELSSSLVAEVLVSQLRGLSGYVPQACKGHLNFVTVGAASNSPSSKKSTLDTEGAPRGGASQGREFVPPTLPPLPRYMKTQIERAAFDIEEYALYRKYQIAVHKDKPEDLGESTYRRFLVDSPLIYVAPGNDRPTPSCGFGTFHQQYRIDGKLVAVAVLDVLPQCLSSYYFFWDPDLASLSLGKYSALREIAWVKDINKVCPSLSHYYLGNYIHTCSKMRYKASYAPSELLCPSTYTWVPFEQALPDLERAQYMCLSHPSTEKKSSKDVAMRINEPKRDPECLALAEENILRIENGDKSSEEEKHRSVSIEKVVLLLDKKCWTFERVKEMIEIPAAEMDELVKELTVYAEGVGPDLASRMVFVSTL